MYYLRRWSDMLYLRSIKEVINSEGIVRKMGAQEFLDKLRGALSGQISANLVEENVAYYREYISSQIRMGQAEHNIIAGLGDPRLIAKSIVSANSAEPVSGEERYRKEYFGEDLYETEPRKWYTPKVVRVNGWIALAISVIVLIVVVKLVFSLLALLLPFLVMGGIAYFFIKLFKDWLN